MCESGTKFVPLSEAAQLLETTETVVLQMLTRNELQGKMVDAAWYVDRSFLNLCDTPKIANIVRHEGCGICGSGCGSGC
jgi:hypothetical protein